MNKRIIFMNLLFCLVCWNLSLKHSKNDYYYYLYYMYSNSVSLSSSFIIFWIIIWLFCNIIYFISNNINTMIYDYTCIYINSLNFSISDSHFNSSFTVEVYFQYWYCSWSLDSYSIDDSVQVSLILFFHFACVRVC